MGEPNTLFMESMHGPLCLVKYALRDLKHNKRITYCTKWIGNILHTFQKSNIIPISKYITQ